MNKLPEFIAFIAITAMIVSCEQNGIGYNKTDSGLQYKIYTENDGDKPEFGHILSVHMKYGTEDTVFFNSRKLSSMPVDIMLNEPDYPGDINEGFAMMSKGDSASFILNAEQFYNHTVQTQVPADIDPKSELFFDIVLVDFMGKDEYIKQQEIASEELMEQSETLAKKEEEDLQEYLEEKKIETKPLESGLIYVEIEKGEGEPVEQGNTVSVHYEGRLLDGTVFDSSERAGEPIEFIAGHGQVISGWDEGITLMNEGGAAKLIIPSFLAYGQQGVQNIIPPFSTLVFDVEVVEVKK